MIVDSKTGLPYIQGDDSAIKKGRSSIVLLNVDECHYETLGFEIENQNNKPKIKCRLPWNHPMIQKIVTLSNKSNKTEDVPQDEVFEKVTNDNTTESNDETNNDDDEVDEDIEMKKDTTTILSDHDETEFSNSENDSDEEIEEDDAGSDSQEDSSDEDN